MLAPLKLNVPTLTFTNDPEVDPLSPITPPNAPLLNVNAVPPNVTTPLDAPFNVSNSTALADNDKTPSTVTTALTGTNAPLATVKVAPAPTVTAVEAKLPLPVSASVPASTRVGPVYVFAPLKLNIPALTFTNEPADPPSSITPANVPLLNVNAVPSSVINPVDAPLIVNNVTAEAANSTVPSTVTTAFTGTAAPNPTLNVPPAATVNAVEAKLPVPVSINVPAFTLVEPVYVFAPDKFKEPKLSFTNDPVPVTPSAITPANVPLLNVNAPSSVTSPVDAPFNVNNVTALAANSTVPFAVTTALTGTIAPLATLNVAPAATFNAVEAKLPLPVSANVPALTVVVPV